VHGGGFYHMVKYLVAPPRLPEELTWFKWEAYATWISGFAMLVLVYYLQAELYLIDPAIRDMTTSQAVVASLGGLVAGWIVYDMLCRMLVGKHDMALVALGFLFLAGSAWLFAQVFSPRGAFMQMGALIGTIMAANVLMVIIPGQRKVVADLVAGRPPNPMYGVRGKQRSLHNNYLTLPAVFVMIANHYPLAYATRWSWVILALTILIGGVVRHFFNTRHKGLPTPWWTWAAAAACGLAMMLLSAQGPAQGERVEVPAGLIVAAADAENVIVGRCSMCHAAEPGYPGIVVAPKGVLLDTPERIGAHRRAILANAVWSNAMPPSNVTGMTPEERQQLAAWLANKDVAP
jgi:uncharacterized membrane protein